jgi:hypothetical protein
MEARTMRAVRGVEQRGSERGADGDRQKDRREGHQSIHDPHDGIVGPADIARGGADRGAEQAGQNDHEQTDRQRHAAAVEHAAQDVAPEIVGAQQVNLVGFAQAIAVVVAERIVGRQDIGRQGHEHDDQEQAETDDEGAIAE